MELSGENLKGEGVHCTLYEISMEISFQRGVEEGTVPFIYGIISVCFNVAPYFQLKNLFFLFSLHLIPSVVF